MSSYAVLLESLRSLNRQIAESFEGLTERVGEQVVIDPREPSFDGSGDLTLPLGLSRRHPYGSEAELDQVRNIARHFATEHPFALSGHENRVSYVVGTGHTYTVVSRIGREVPSDVLAEARRIVRDFLEQNHWSQRQQENLFRRDRDGEVFLRTFLSPEGDLRVRYIEPEHVREHPHQTGSPFGLLRDLDDAEQIIGYLMHSGVGLPPEVVPASDVQHRTRGLDCACPRGIPLFWPVRSLLQRASNILRNMATVSEVQSAIALIRKHSRATQQAVQSLVNANANASNTTPTGNASRPVQQFRPGTILDVPQETEYDFVAQKADPTKYVAALQACLRAIAARLVMPEFMLTADASNSNFASTLVAEGPAVKMFERLQQDEMHFDRALLRKALVTAEEAGRLPFGLVADVEIIAEGPNVKVRDLQAEAETARILSDLGYLSPQTGAARFGLDHAQERRNLAELNDTPEA